MSRVLIYSSFVAVGHVGASAGVPALARLGHQASVLPSIMLSNHPGFGVVAGAPVPVEGLEELLAAMEQNRFLGQHDALQIGYMPTAAHVAFAVELVQRYRASRPLGRVVVDPVIGDFPGGMYVDKAVAVAIRDTLVRLADLTTPNAFELQFLTGSEVGAIEVAGKLGVGCVVTSPPIEDGKTGLYDARDRRLYRADMRADVPHGTGDVLAAMLAAGIAPGAALGHLTALVEASLGQPHLALATDDWVRAGAIEGEALGRDGV